MDVLWKVVATVMGHCFLFFGRQSLETWAALIWYAEEFLFEPILHFWKDGEDNFIFDLFMSGMTWKTSLRWLNVCMETTYEKIGTKQYRPIRPLSRTIREKEESNLFLVWQEFTLMITESTGEFKCQSLNDTNLMFTF